MYISGNISKKKKKLINIKLRVMAEGAYWSWDWREVHRCLQDIVNVLIVLFLKLGVDRSLSIKLIFNSYVL